MAHSEDRCRRHHLLKLLCAGVSLAIPLTGATPALAAKQPLFTRSLNRGDTGQDVRALQTRIAGWFPSAKQVAFQYDGVYGKQTVRAVKTFRKSYGMTVTPRASMKVLKKIEGMKDPDGSTAHFEWEEFMQNSSASCSEKANSYAGTFRGGKVRAGIVKRNIRRMMWRLEAVRHKAGDKSIGINSGFRSVAYNECIGGATASQHQFGTAVDLRIVETDNKLAREIAKKSQFQGIGCYSELTHNHFDLRIDNRSYEGSQAWWWPEKDKKGRDLDEAGKPCWGEGGTKIDKQSLADSQIQIAGLVIGLGGIGSTEPSDAEMEAFEARGESGDYEGRD